MRLQFKKIISKPELVFVIIAGFFGVLSATMMPILEVPDENQHFQVSYAIFSKNQQAGKDLVLTEGMVVDKLEKGTYWNLFTDKTSAKDDGIAINTGSLVFDGKTRASIFDAMRITQAFGVLTGKIIYPSLGVMVLFGRLFVLLLFLVSIYLVIKKVRYGKWVFVLLATVPIIVQQAASISYDAINLIAIFAWVAYIINLATQKTILTKRQVIIGLVLALFLMVSKSNNLLLLGLIFALPSAIITETSLYRKVRALSYWRSVKYITITLLVLVFIAGAYFLQKKLLAGHEFDLKSLLSVLMNTFIWGDLTLIDVTTIGTIGQFGIFYYHLPIWVVIIAYIVIVITLLHEKMPTVSKKFAVISLAIFISSVLLITIGMYYGWAMKPERLGTGASVADGIQGRYFTPLLILLLPTFAYLQNFINIRTRNKFTVPILVISTSIFLLCIYIAQTWRTFYS